MTTSELYINGKRVDLPQDFSIRLNRQLLNPSELNTKDAQYSYSITLPPTRVNHLTFNMANVEETRDKFNRVYTAELIINGVRIFEGVFRLSDISRSSYKGNLYVPSVKSIKDIFGDIALNANAELRIPFADFATSVSEYNEAARTEVQYAIFPYVLYGVLPKAPLNKNANTYSSRTLWDASVYIGMADLPPSINVLLMLRHIFTSQGYTLQGSAFEDERLTRLYMSYKNADTYVQPWNYGQHAKMRIVGNWGSIYNKRTPSVNREYERGVNQSYADNYNAYSCDLLDSTNSRVIVAEDSGGNILLREVNDADGVTWVNGQIRIPASGFYKVMAHASLKVYDNSGERYTDPATGVQHVSGTTDHANNHFWNKVYEFHVLRDRKAGDFGLNGAKLDGAMYYDNMPQNETFDGDNIPKYFPQVSADGMLTLVDLAQDSNIITGFSFGRREGKNDYVNPRDTGQRIAQVLAAKPSQSWNGPDNLDDGPTRLAVPSPGYWKYGRIGTFDNEDDNPDIDIDYSGGTRVTGKVLDVNGNPQDPAAVDLSARTHGFYVAASTGVLTIDDLWQCTALIDLNLFQGLKFSATIEDGAEVAVTAFYDKNSNYLGYGLIGQDGVTTPYTDEPVTGPAGAAYVRISVPEDTTLTITYDALASAQNVILERFKLDRYFTYVITTPAGSGYEGSLFVHEGPAIVAPRLVVPFVNGAATFNTNDFSSTGAEPYLTLYLKTAAFDVDGTLVISRQITANSEDVIDWETTNKYKIDLINAPANYARRGWFNSEAADPDWNGEGNASVIVWLEAGELITVASVSEEGRYRARQMHSTFGWTNHEINYTLSIQPFRTDADWLKVNLAGNGTGIMNWNDAPNFDTDNINLTGFLSADMKTNDFIDNFVKAFNLQLSQIDDNAFSLDVKQSRAASGSRWIDFDKKASVRDRANTALGLPSLYRLGFTVDTDEEGYQETGDNGGGEYRTGATEENTVEQKSTFSYNWFKAITKDEAPTDVILNLPIISKSDVWEPTMSYPDAMSKRYTDLAYRFWYFDGALNDIGATFDFNGQDISIAKVSNEIPGTSILNYKNQQYTILDNFFTLLINGSSHYTEIEAYLTPDEYKALNGSILARFNSDLYFVADISGYDPANRNKAKIKLIRKI